MKIVFRIIERKTNIVLCLLIPRISKKYPMIANQLFLYIDGDGDSISLADTAEKDNRRWCKIYGGIDSHIPSVAPGWLFDSEDWGRVISFCKSQYSEFNNIFAAQAKITNDIYEEVNCEN